MSIQSLNLKSAATIFELTEDQITLITDTRLRPQNNDRGRWGCASLTGFLASQESLLDVVRADQRTLKTRSVSYKTIAARLAQITSAAVRALGKPSLTPVLVEEGKFEVTVSIPTLCAQFCPFSPEDDEHGGLQAKRYLNVK